MKKIQLKFAVKQAMRHYYKTGMTNTAASVLTEINKSIDLAYKKKHKGGK